MPLEKNKNNPTRAISLEATDKDMIAIGKSWFFGIGINEYKHFSSLNNAVGDVEAIRNILQQKYLLDESITLFNEEATRRDIFKKLKYLLEQVGPDDKLFVLFSGHGYFSTTQEGFWVPYEAEPEFYDEFLPNFHLKHYLKHIKARHILVVSDSCFSGSLFAEGTTRKYTGPEERLEGKKSRYGICSGRDNEEVWDGPAGGHSPFAESIIEFLEENQEPRFRASLLAETVFNRTTVAYRQTPRHGQLFGVGDKGGQYVFRLREVMPLWETAWQAVQQLPEDHLNDLHAKIVHIDEYIDQYHLAGNLTEAYQLGEMLEQKIAFFLAKGSMFRLKQYSRKQTPFQEEAQKLLAQYKAGYVQPVEDRETEPLPTKQAVQPQAGKPVSKKESPNSFTDTRDGQTYRTVELNGLRWMSQNLNFDVGKDCWFYENDRKNGERYGRLYTWEAAKKACPPGWRLPTDEEWKSLAKSVGGYYDFKTIKEVGDPKKGYTTLMEEGSSGLSAQLGGYRNSTGSFGSLGSGGNYWSATEYGSGYAWFYSFNRINSKLYRGGYDSSAGLSCRCVQDLTI